MNTLTDLEFRILDELYFLTSYQTLLENFSEDRDAVRDALTRMLLNEFVIQVRYENGEEKKIESPDLSALEQSYFVASKKGLLIHNSRN